MVGGFYKRLFGRSIDRVDSYMNTIKHSIYKLRVLHGRIHEWRLIVLPYYIQKLKHPKAAYLVFTPEHGNLGDHAIAQSEKLLFKELGVQFIEITENKLKELNRLNFLRVINRRTVFVHGGGYLGTLWMNCEYMLRDIIQQNPKAKIVLFPNTIYYENNEFGQEEFEISKSIYNSHKNLKIFAREHNSYLVMQQAYNNVYLVPDMVLLMNQCKPQIERNGCILCLRRDLEKTRSDEEEQIITETAHHLFGDDVHLLDMVSDYPIFIEQRDEELEKQYSAFRHAKLVITDRLHGMIFAAITGTPCIVINSKSPKVKGCYEWVKDLEYIQFCDDVSQIADIYNSIPVKDWKYDNSYLLPLYKPLKAEILKATKSNR